MSESHYIRTRMVTERRLEEAMDKLEKNTDQVASRLRTKWRREDEAWARGEEPPPPEPVEDDVSPEADPKLYHDATTEMRAEWDAIRTGDVFRTAAQERVEQPRSQTMWERWRSYWHRF